jgi:hypothetical protein
MPVSNPALSAACACASLLLLWLSLHLRRRHRLLADLPTSKAQGVFIGLIELKGTVESEAPLHSFLAGTACVHYAFEVQEHWSRTVTETYTDKDGRPQTRTRTESGWNTVAQGGETQDFYLRDDTGVILVRPEGAKLEPLSVFDETASRGEALYYAKGPPHSVAHSDHRRRFVEHALPLHGKVFVVGQARERDDIVAPEIARAPEAPLFLVTTRTEESVQARHSAWSWAWWALGLAAAVGAGFGLLSRTGGGPWPLVAAMGVYLLAWALGWTWMVFNSLIGLRQRVRQGWSLIDVELKRRHDLIAPLATIVASLGSHEQEVQTAMAALRTQLAATKPGREGPDPEGLVTPLRVVAERYPTLVAQRGFSELHEALVETEQRIALARGYYNDIATYFATRLERIPDRWVSRLAGMKPEPLLAAGNFERAPVPVNLSPG